MPRQRGTTEAGTRRRAQILEEAEILVESIGFDELKMESIADSIGVAKSTLYHYFPQKEDVLFAIHEATMSEQICHLTAIIESDAPATEKLREAITDQLRLIAEHPGRVRVLMDSRRDKDRPYRDQMAKLERTYMELLAGLLQAGMKSGQFRKRNPVLMAQAILGMTQHARYWLHADRPGGYLVVSEELWQLVCSGLVAS